jgi:hypothetical protein
MRASETNAAADFARRSGPILAAALALPGVAGAEGAPQDALIGLKYLYYREFPNLAGTTGLKPLVVNSPSVYALMPIGNAWSVEGSAVYDSISGATPRSHTTSAATMSDQRAAGDVRVTRYFRRAALGVGFAYSTENDYESMALSSDLRLSTDDNNTTFTIGVGYANDKIKVNTEHPLSQTQLPTDANGDQIAQHKRTPDFMIGITQVLSPSDIVQANWTYAAGRGYFTDPYKFADNRPSKRNQSALLVRWNHHFTPVDGTLRLSYRYYSDTFSVSASTIGAEWVQPLGAFTLTPELRYHTQNAARFYVDPVNGAPVPPTDPTLYYSTDYRLSAFGGITAGLRAAWQINKDWSIDGKATYYEQRADWRLSGKGSPGLDPFRAAWYQLGIYKRF